MIELAFWIAWLIVLSAICIFICWRVDKDCRAVEDIWKQTLDRMK